MRIALITYHYGYNEGTLLQAYATQELLKECIPGAEVEIVDWRSPAKEEVAFRPPENERERALRSFFETRLTRTKETFRTPTPEPVFRYLREHFHLVVVGSDELWRLDYRLNGRWPFRHFVQDNPWAPPFPNIYWPDAAKLGLPCVSLASSISDKDHLCLVPASHRRRIRKALRNFELLSVRDSRTEAFVISVCPEAAPKCHWLPDPTFSLRADLSAARDAFGKCLRATGLEPGKPLALVVSATKSNVLNQLLALCRKKGMRVVGITGSQPGLDADLSSESIGPLEFAAATAFARVVITDRFHGAVFSIQNRVPVIAVDYRHQTSGADSKIRDLFKRLGIENRCLFVQSPSSDTMEAIEPLLDAESWPAEGLAARTSEFNDMLRTYASGPVRQVAEENLWS